MTNGETIEILKLYKQRLDKSCSNLLENDKEAFDLAIKALEERPKGKWLKSSNMSKRSYQRLCSNCKHIVYFCGDGNYPNCPYCLADMRGDV